MLSGIVQSAKPITLLGAGACAPAVLDRALALAPQIVAADGGANVAVDRGLTPRAVIGDLDSIRDDVRAALGPGRVHLVSEQETTDFEKCLTRIDAPLVLAVGFTGRRADHVLSVWNTLARHPGSPCIVLSDEDAAFIAPPRLRLALAPGTRLSLFPMGAARGVSQGLAWPIDGLEFAPDAKIGTSNRATGPVTLNLEGAPMLVILPAECLAAAIKARARGASSQRSRPPGPRGPAGARAR